MLTEERVKEFLTYNEWALGYPAHDAQYAAAQEVAQLCKDWLAMHKQLATLRVITAEAVNWLDSPWQQGRVDAQVRFRARLTAMQETP